MTNPDNKIPAYYEYKRRIKEAAGIFDPVFLVWNVKHDTFFVSYCFTRETIESYVDFLILSELAISQLEKEIENLKS